MGSTKYEILLPHLIRLTDICAGQHLVTYPIANGRILNVGVGVSYPGQEGKVYDGPWMSSASKEEITKHFSGWEPDAQEIVKVGDP